MSKLAQGAAASCAQRSRRRPAAVLGSLDNRKGIVRFGCITRYAGDFREPPKVADSASELRPDVLKDKRPCRLVYGVAKSSVRHSSRAGGSLKWNDGLSHSMSVSQTALLNN